VLVATVGAVLIFAASRSVGVDETQLGIYLIEVARTNEVLIHFNTAPVPPAHSNVLQYSDTLKPGAVWSNLFVAPTLPFSNHYAISQYRTVAQQRFYRLIIN
jgi:hypothetical protein